MVPFQSPALPTCFHEPGWPREHPTRTTTIITAIENDLPFIPGPPSFGTVDGIPLSVLPWRSVCSRASEVTSETEITRTEGGPQRYSYSSDQTARHFLLCQNSSRVNFASST